MIYLYVKTHNVTGLKYFGKTMSDPYKYLGSGIYWKRHLSIHGNDISTEIIAEFEDEIKCCEFATSFSQEHQIVESPDWANLIEENGLDGAPANHPPHVFTDDQKTKISQKSKEMWADVDRRRNLIQAQKDSWTLERRSKQSQRLAGVARPDHSQKMKGHPGHTKCKNKPKPEGFGEKVSLALKGKPKSQSHKESLSISKNRICRLTDGKEMSVNHYTRWLKSLQTTQ